MAYHAKNGREFVGLRAKYGGGMQVVYDAVTGRRLVLEIMDRSVSESTIHDALREGIASKYVLGGVMSALKARSIDVDVVE